MCGSLFCIAGFNVETVDVNSTKLTIWDVGGQRRHTSFFYFSTRSILTLLFVVFVVFVYLCVSVRCARVYL